MNFEHIMFTNHIVLKQTEHFKMFDKCYNFQCSNLGHFLQCSHVIPNPAAMKDKVVKVVPSYFCGGVYNMSHNHDRHLRIMLPTH